VLSKAGTIVSQTTQSKALKLIFFDETYVCLLLALLIHCCFQQMWMVFDEKFPSVLTLLG